MDSSSIADNAKLTDRHELEVEKRVRACVPDREPNDIYLVFHFSPTSDCFSESELLMAWDLLNTLCKIAQSSELATCDDGSENAAFGIGPLANERSRDAYFCMAFGSRQVRNAVLCAENVLHSFAESQLAFRCDGTVVVGSSSFAAASLLRYAQPKAVSLDPVSYAQWNEVAGSDDHRSPVVRIGALEIIEFLEQQQKEASNGLVSDRCHQN